MTDKALGKTRVLEYLSDLGCSACANEGEDCGCGSFNTLNEIVTAVASQAQDAGRARDRTGAIAHDALREIAEYECNCWAREERVPAGPGYMCRAHKALAEIAAVTE